MNPTQTLTRVSVSHIQPMFSNTLSSLLSPLSSPTTQTVFLLLAKTVLVFCLPGPYTAGPVLFMKSLFNSPLQLGLNSNGKFNYIREVSSLFLKQLAFYGGNLFLSQPALRWRFLVANIKQYSLQYVSLCLIFRMFSMFLYSFYSGEYQ